MRVVVKGLIQAQKGGDYLLLDSRVGARKVIDIPGGGLEPGESLAKALSREMREEVGLEVEIPEGVQPLVVTGYDLAGSWVLVGIFQLILKGLQIERLQLNYHLSGHRVDYPRWSSLDIANAFPPGHWWWELSQNLTLASPIRADWDYSPPKLQRGGRPNVHQTRP